MSKKFILIVLIAVLCCNFCFAEGTPVIDVSLIYETILQKMEALEQYAKEIEHMRTQIEHYTQQYKQIQTYYEELKGLTDKLLSSDSFSEAWNTTKSVLKKCIQINKKRGQMENEAFEVVTGAMNQHAACVEYLNKQHTYDNEFDNLKMKLIIKYNDRIDYYEDAFMKAYNRNTQAFEERQNRKNDAKEYNQTLLREAEKRDEQLRQYLAYLQANDESLQIIIETLKAEKADLLEIKASLMEAYNEYYTQHQSFIEGGNLTEAQRSDLETTLSATATMIEQVDDRITDINYKLEVYAYYMDKNTYTMVDYEVDVQVIESEIKMYQAELERLSSLD